MNEKRYGRRPPKNAPAVRFAALREDGALPEYPANFDALSGYGGWQMLHNDEWGDCVVVTYFTLLLEVHPSVGPRSAEELG